MRSTWPPRRPPQCWAAATCWGLSTCSCSCASGTTLNTVRYPRVSVVAFRWLTICLDLASQLQPSGPVCWPPHCHPVRPARALHYAGANTRVFSISYCIGVLFVVRRALQTSFGARCLIHLKAHLRLLGRESIATLDAWAKRTFQGNANKPGWVWAQLPSIAMHALHPASAFEFAASLEATLAALPALNLAAAEGMSRWEAHHVASAGAVVTETTMAVRHVPNLLIHRKSALVRVLCASESVSNVVCAAGGTGSGGAGCIHATSEWLDARTRCCHSRGAGHRQHHRVGGRGGTSAKCDGA
jgi:hypothetical protein